MMKIGRKRLVNRLKRLAGQHGLKYLLGSVNSNHVDHLQGGGVIQKVVVKRYLNLQVHLCLVGNSLGRIQPSLTS